MSAPSSPEDQLRAWYARLPREVASELTPVRASKLPYPYLLHISRDNKIEKFVPSVTNRSLNGEDRSVPRVSTATTLAGCIIGYASDLHDFMTRPTTRSGDGTRKVSFAGGWTIYGVPFEFAVVPSKKLLPDVRRTEERWLVNYSDQWIQYPAIKLGKFFYQTVSYVAGKDGPDTVVEMIVEVLTDDPIVFDDKHILTKGCWKLVISGMHTANRWDKIPVVQCEELEQRKYDESKMLIASMLSFEQYAPPSMGGW